MRRPKTLTDKVMRFTEKVVDSLAGSIAKKLLDDQKYDSVTIDKNVTQSDVYCYPDFTLLRNSQRYGWYLTVGVPHKPLSTIANAFDVQIGYLGYLSLEQQAEIADQVAIKVIEVIRVYTNMYHGEEFVDNGELNKYVEQGEKANEYFENLLNTGEA